jgi:hypothetical protein
MSRTFLHDHKDDEQLSPVRIDDRMEVWASARIQVRDEPDIEADLDIICQYSEKLGKRVAIAVHVMQRKDGPEITSKILRTIKVQEYMRPDNLLISFRHRYRGSDGSEGDGEVNEVTTLDQILERARMHDADEFQRDELTWISRTYLYAQIVGLDPAKEVSRHFSLSPRTATRRIAQARDLGLLKRG